MILFSLNYVRAKILSHLNFSWSGFRATDSIILKLDCWLHFRNKKWGLPNSFLRCEQLIPHYGFFL